MGMLRIEIDDSNAAFEDAPATEVGRILRELAESFEQDGGPDIEYIPAILRDINGNRVGFVAYDHDAYLCK
jgi:hypothetical protein